MITSGFFDLKVGVNAENRMVFYLEKTLRPLPSTGTGKLVAEVWQLPSGLWAGKAYEIGPNEEEMVFVEIGKLDFYGICSYAASILNARAEI